MRDLLQCSASTRCGCVRPATPPLKAEVRLRILELGLLILFPKARAIPRVMAKRDKQTDTDRSAVRLRCDGVSIMSFSFLYRRCIIALLLALWCACIFALSAWGTIEIPWNTPYPFAQGLSRFAFADANQLAGGAGLFSQSLVWVGLGMFGLMLWGQWLFLYKRRKTDTPWPWRALFMSSALHSAWWVMQTLSIVNHPSWYQHLTQASLGVFLFLAVMAEQVDIRWGQVGVVFFCAGVLLFCVFKFLLIESIHVVDARFFLAIQILPLLLIPVGIFNSNDQSKIFHNELLFICIVYAGGMFATWVPNIFSGEHVNSHLGVWWRVLPWCGLLSLLLLLMISIGRTLQQRNLSWMINFKLNKPFQMSANGFSFESLPASSRQKIS